MKQRIKVCKLGLGDTTTEGAFYPQLDGITVGENGRAFWQTELECREAAERIMAVKDGQPASGGGAI